MIFFKKKNPFLIDIEPLVNQVIGGQSVIFRLSKENFLLSEKEIRKIEITYFCLTIICSCYLDSPRVTLFTDKGNSLDEKSLTDYVSEVMDNVAISVLKKSIPNCDEEISLEVAAKEYKKKYNNYSPSLTILKEYPVGVFQGSRIERYNKQISSTEKEETKFNLIELLLIFFQSINLQNPSTPPMTNISSSVMIFRDFYIDNIVFVNQKLQKISS